MKRSNRLVVLTDFFLENPRKHIQLPYFVELCDTTKSSISEDLDIIHAVFQSQGMGFLQRSTGAGGGVKYIPEYSQEKICNLLRNCAENWKTQAGYYQVGIFT